MCCAKHSKKKLWSFTNQVPHKQRGVASPSLQNNPHAFRVQHYKSKQYQESIQHNTEQTKTEIYFNVLPAKIWKNDYAVNQVTYLTSLSLLSVNEDWRVQVSSKKLIHVLRIFASTLHEPMDFVSSSSYEHEEIGDGQCKK